MNRTPIEWVHPDVAEHFPMKRELKVVISVIAFSLSVVGSRALPYEEGTESLIYLRASTVPLAV